MGMTTQQFEMPDGKVHLFEMPSGLPIPEMEKLALESYNQAQNNVKSFELVSGSSELSKCNEAMEVYEYKDQRLNALAKNTISNKKKRNQILKNDETKTVTASNVNKKKKEKNEGIEKD